MELSNGRLVLTVFLQALLWKFGNQIQVDRTIGTGMSIPALAMDQTSQRMETLDG